MRTYPSNITVYSGCACCSKIDYTIAEGKNALSILSASYFVCDASCRKISSEEMARMLLLDEEPKGCEFSPIYDIKDNIELVDLRMKLRGY
jgi:hypothetical protein